MLPIADMIERRLVLPAPRLAVWEKSFATPSSLSSWFPDRVEGEFGLGQNFTLIWGEHRSECRLAEFSPGESLAFQWHPGVGGLLTLFPEEELTTVRFTLEDHPEGTLVVMQETGFMNIPEERRTSAFSENDGGWDSELPKLEKSHTK